ncbi:uncharacterized protein LY89DRAFT_732142 [Mollisia scopiformis]|uniref:Uncharacterized protein n=1 Tax=Mollisia scopiformis TaxID=149040 RepID=A0A194XEG9_MOLSC|nr:uncharacterized protein LY89DRAFT_732142 [Mollisia scopiformis]KUJ18585.1 hypothetical protein LY89DRAFT_732142 [Mollisia scopiformis]
MPEALVPPPNLTSTSTLNPNFPLNHSQSSSVNQSKSDHMSQITSLCRAISKAASHPNVMVYRAQLVQAEKDFSKGYLGNGTKDALRVGGAVDEGKGKGKRKEGLDGGDEEMKEEGLLRDGEVEREKDPGCDGEKNGESEGT